MSLLKVLARRFSHGAAQNGNETYRASRCVSSLVLAVLCLCGTAWASLEKTAARTRVLFIGNSLTTANDLPGLVAALFGAAGGGPIESGIADPSA